MAVVRRVLRPRRRDTHWWRDGASASPVLTLALCTCSHWCKCPCLDPCSATSHCFSGAASAHYFRGPLNLLTRPNHQPEAPAPSGSAPSTARAVGVRDLPNAASGRADKHEISAAGRGSWHQRFPASRQQLPAPPPAGPWMRAQREPLGGLPAHSSSKGAPPWCPAFDAPAARRPRPTGAGARGSIMSYEALTPGRAPGDMGVVAHRPGMEVPTLRGMLWKEYQRRMAIARISPRSTVCAAPRPASAHPPAVPGWPASPSTTRRGRRRSHRRLGRGRRVVPRSHPRAGAVR